MTTPTTQSLPIGSTLQGGKYRITQELGRGGFGITYLALQVALDREVAIKEFFIGEYCDRAANATSVTVGSRGSREVVSRYRTKFVKEARTIARLQNAHIIRIHDIFEENGTAYYVMEYIDGGSLGDMVKSHGPLDEATALGYVRQVGDALTYLHDRNILHLDIKPDNVLLRKQGEVVLIDFGISKHYDDEGGQTSTTPAGISRGYAPIEQYEQGGINRFQPATDIYALGATLYTLLTGLTPPVATELNEESLPTAPLSDRGVSAATRSVILRAMSPKKKQRYQTAGEMMADLPCKEEGTATKAVTPAKPKPRRMLKGLALAAVAIIAIVAVVIAVGSGNNHQDDALPDDIDYTIAGYEYVDLGLSVKWATCNVGASSPSDYGNYYAWGETNTKPEYTEKNSKTDGNSSYDHDIGGDVSTDAARANWGDKWRLPTKEEFKELMDNCEWEWTTQGGHKGYKVTSKKNGASIFLPAAGNRLGSSRTFADEWGGYWTSTPREGIGAWYLLFSSTTHIPDGSRRYYGRSVRPVAGSDRPAAGSIFHPAE